MSRYSFDIVACILYILQPGDSKLNSINLYNQGDFMRTIYM